MSDPTTHGHKTWYFPDGDLPQPGDREPHGHESLVILNPHPEQATILITVYFPDQEPRPLAEQQIEGHRVRCFRMDKPIDGFQVPFGQYALKIESTTPVICQLGRMDVQQPNLAYYTVLGHPA